MNETTWERKYYENGTLCQEDPYVRGIKHGLIRNWYRNGTLSWEAPYVRGVLYGLIKYWSSNGMLKEISLWNNGVEICYWSTWKNEIDLTDKKLSLR